MPKHGEILSHFEERVLARLNKRGVVFLSMLKGHTRAHIALDKLVRLGYAYRRKGAYHSLITQK
jgi:hypothetical protein